MLTYGCFFFVWLVGVGGGWHLHGSNIGNMEENTGRGMAEIMSPYKHHWKMHYGKKSY